MDRKARQVDSLAWWLPSNEPRGRFPFGAGPACQSPTTDRDGRSSKDHTGRAGPGQIANAVGKTWWISIRQLSTSNSPFCLTARTNFFFFIRYLARHAFPNLKPPMKSNSFLAPSLWLRFQRRNSLRRSYITTTVVQLRALEKKLNKKKDRRGESKTARRHPANNAAPPSDC